MSAIVLGLASSHSPQVSTVPELWHLYAERDYENPALDMDRLKHQAAPDLDQVLTSEVFRERFETCQAEISRLSDALRAAAPDVVLIVGDDQRELFRDECMPAFAVFTGSELFDIPPEPESVSPRHKPALWSRHNTCREGYPLVPALAEHIVRSLVRDGFDVAAASKQSQDRGLGHAFTFVRLRLMGKKPVPIVPVFINTYYPPNQPTPKRCYAFGRALRRAIASSDRNVRIAIVASGGLSHRVIDEALDRQLLDGIAQKRSDLLVGMPEDKLVDGSSEIRNWIAVAGALEDFAVVSLEYVPGYRTVSGTGCGMAFVQWAPRP